MSTPPRIAKLLKDKKKTLAIAESCTGGLLCHRLTNIPGSSDFLTLGLVTYSNASKIKLAKVSPKLIKNYGAVSEQVSMAMAKNVRQLAKSDFGIGITGIAGPAGGSQKKPVGLVYISVSTVHDVLCLKCQFQGTREHIKQRATSQAFKLLNEFLA